MTMTDFHSHILPGMDDGSRSLEESIEMLRMEAEQGITCVVASPHFYPRYDDPAHFLAKREASAQQLREEMARYNDLPQLVLGAEVYYFRGMSESDQLSRLTIEGKNSILIEMPTPPWTEEMYRELETLWVRRGVRPIIAHIDRYIRPFHTYGIPGRLARLPVLVQANAEFFLDKRTAGMALRMLKEERIHLLGSDCHDLRERKPNLGPVLQKIHHKFGAESLRRIEYIAQDVLDI
jgi:protein-tyrosine phosphatase